jgi:hypothetical protein
MRTLPLLACTLAALALTSCVDGDGTSPAAPPATPPPDVARAAFVLSIDMVSGNVDLTAPSLAAADNGPSFSLVGADAVSMTATPCSFSAIPKNTKKVRCTLQLSLANRLDAVDLVTPTVPAPPAGTNGILVFPYTAAAQTTTGGTVVPNADWDNAPVNFFNDFGGCAGGKESDCYRSETYPGPLLAGESTPERTVGFDVDKAAQRVSVYLLVAADLGRRAALADIPDRCGSAIEEEGGNTTTIVPAEPVAGASLLGTLIHGLCGFDLGELPTGGRVVGAKLRLYQNKVAGTPYLSFGDLIVDHVDLGSDVDDADYDSTPLQAAIGVLSSTPALGWKTVDVTDAVLDDLTSGRQRSEFRLRFAAEERTGGDDYANFDGPSGANPPELVVILGE